MEILPSFVTGIGEPVYVGRYMSTTEGGLWGFYSYVTDLQTGKVVDRRKVKKLRRKGLL